MLTETRIIFVDTNGHYFLALGVRSEFYNALALSRGVVRAYRVHFEPDDDEFEEPYLYSNTVWSVHTPHIVRHFESVVDQ